MICDFISAMALKHSYLISYELNLYDHTELKQNLFVQLSASADQISRICLRYICFAFQQMLETIISSDNEDDD
jgi:hypothetical protein